MGKHKMKMHAEHSAGGIVMKESPGGLTVLVIRDRSDTYGFPKGHVEAGETLEETAVREIREETGIEGLVCLGALGEVHYRFQRQGTVHKTVSYFLFKAQGNALPVPQAEEHISEARFVPVQDAFGMIGYPKTNVPIFEKAIERYKASQEDAS